VIRVAILGGTGYTALELIRILLRHPQVEITALTSRSDTGPVERVHPSLAGRLTLQFSNPSTEELTAIADVCFCCLPHRASMDVIPALLAAGLRVVDLSADYRLADPEVYEKWYGHVHVDPTRLGVTAYGLPEVLAPDCASQNLIANPGCYTSASILALAPLLKAGLIKPTGIIIDAKSGVSGAGRSPKVETLYSECNESLSAYGIGNHRHTPEIEQVLSQVSGQKVEVIFTPHLVPMDRGILATIYADPARELAQSEVMQTLQDYYRGKTFVNVVDHLPRTKDVAGSNFCQITARVVHGKVMVFSVLDNLIKGASGVAVQNFNLMCGFDETTALL